MRFRRVSTPAAIGLLTLGLAHGAVASAQAPREEFSATLSNISNVGGVGLTPLTIRINRWTSDADHERLMGLLRDKGQDAFLRALNGQDDVGSIATPVSLKYDFFYARQEALAEGGRKIFMITDRPMDIYERLNSSRSRDYPFTVIEMTLDRDGRGQGTLAQLVQLRLIGNFLGIENLATSPMKLADIKKVK
jgi:hypothetical protein